MRSPRRPVLMGVTAIAASVLAVSGAAAQERFNVGGDHVAVYNLAGEVDVVGTTGGDVTVEVRRAGADASQLRVEVGEIGGGVEALRVIYPADRIVYDDGPGWGGSSELRVRPDGTWGGGEGWRNSGDRVRVSGRGSGLEAHADLRIGVPRGQRVDIYLAVGRITAENVEGRILLDTHSGGIIARSMRGFLRADTGSGEVEVAGMEGDLEVDVRPLAPDAAPVGKNKQLTVGGPDLQIVFRGQGEQAAAYIGAKWFGNLDMGQTGTAAFKEGPYPALGKIEEFNGIEQPAGFAQGFTATQLATQQTM